MKKDDSYFQVSQGISPLTLRAGRRLTTLLAVLALVLGSGAVTAQTPLGSTFTYQGQLQQSDRPADGVFDLEFRLYDGPDPLSATQLGVDAKNDVAVTYGLFTVTLDFGGGQFDGDARWLEIGAKEAGDPSFTYLSPLQELTTTPNAQYAQQAGDADTLGGLTVSALVASGVPSGAIIMWSGSLTGIPAGWVLCDGTGGTPNLIDRFIFGVSIGEEPGAVGGSSSHGHSIATAGAHTHSGTTDPSGNFSVDTDQADREAAQGNHIHSFTTDSAGSHTHSASSESHLPPYFKLAFIMKL